MMRAFSTPLLAALLLAAVSPAAAAPAHAHAAHASANAGGVTSDVRCLLTMAALGQDKQRQQAALIGAYFFAGRLSASAPGLDLPGAVKAEEAKMTPKDLPAEAQRCGPMVQGAMHSLQVSFGGPGGAQPAQAPGPAPAPAPAPAPIPPATPK